VAVANLSQTDGPALLQAGASACISMADSLQWLIAAIQALKRNGVAIPKGMGMAQSPTATMGISELSTREREVLQLLSSGLSNKQIGYQLGISLSTVKNHVHSILNKLKLSRRRETLVWSISERSSQIRSASAACWASR
jgi:DNA-binding NarL/FixJ family response regulator